DYLLRVVTDDLVHLVTFAGAQHEIAGPGQLDRLLDGRAAIRYRQQTLFCVFPGVRGDAALNLQEDPIRIFAARIVGGDHDEIAETASHGAHQRTLRAVAVPAAAEDRDQPAARERPRRLEQIAQGIVGMCVVNDNGDFVFRVRNELKTTGDAVERSYTALD